MYTHRPYTHRHAHAYRVARLVPWSTGGPPDPGRALLVLALVLAGIEQRDELAQRLDHQRCPGLLKRRPIDRRPGKDPDRRYARGPRSPDVPGGIPDCPASVSRYAEALGRKQQKVRRRLRALHLAAVDDRRRHREPECRD